ncbi:type II toxin-antitoxin system death-on-curing family toxin [Fluviicola sp.]|uniref:type II toxin-antitoxin system death-on-curing family toxin n=1 Tax=Fluviicola sp. TaxID=1917219 RepID=UPI00260B2584|nr:type II toxin-antitoxin system death-on-curing family toxin [Fluviicola sp.]
MESITTNAGKKIFCLDTEGVIHLHDLLSNNVHLLEEMDPVEPRGIKNKGMLESAIGRQFAGFGDFNKYDDCFSNVATLAFGVIKNHAFHNGNKRTGLLCIVKHLYNNGYVLSPELDSKEFYEFLVSIADSSLYQFFLKYIKKYPMIRSKGEKRLSIWDTDMDIRFMAFWIKKNSSPKANTIKGNVKISTLKKAVRNKHIKINQNGSNLECELERESKFLGVLLGSKMKKIYSLGNNRSEVDKITLSNFRKDFNLTKMHGVDDTFFYEEEAFLDSEIKAYKQIIYQLSKT